MATGTAAKKTAVRASTNGKATKQVEFRELKLKIPAKCPGKVLFDLGDDNVTATLRTLLGTKQYGAVIDKVVEDGLDLDETTVELTGFLTRIFENAYGLSAGE